MSIKEFLNQAKGMWVTTKNCNINDIVTVMSQPTIDNTSFQGKTYLVMDVKLERTGEALKLRLGGQQVQNLVGVFGDNAPAWIGKRIKIAAKQTYPGLGKDGFIFVPA